MTSSADMANGALFRYLTFEREYERPSDEKEKEEGTPALLEMYKAVGAS